MSAKPQKAKRVTLQFNILDGSSNEASDIHSRLKSSAEIAEFSMAEDLPELERIAQLLDSRNELQRLAGVVNVARCVPDFGAAAFISLFKRFSKAVQRGDDELQREAANTLVKILPEVNDVEFLVTSCIPFIEKTIVGQHGTVAQWVEALIVAAIAADRASLDAFTAFALQCAGADQSASLRATACRLLSWLCTVVPARPPADMARIQAAIRLLCQDIDKEVRAAMAAQLAAIASKLDGQGREQLVLKEIVELIGDEEIGVKVTAMGALVDMIPSLQTVFGLDRILAQVLRLFREAEAASATGPLAALRLEASRLLGAVLHRISLNGSPSALGQHAAYLLDLFRALAQDPVPAIRRYCAYNMPAVVQFAGRGQHAAPCHAALLALVGDGDAEVRLTIAGGFHELLPFVQRDRLVSLLKPCFFKLLRDADVRVQIAIVARIDEILAAFRRYEGHPETNAIVALIPVGVKAGPDDVVDDPAEAQMGQDERVLRALLDYEGKLDLRWRERETLLRKLGALCTTLNPELILQLWSETILGAMHAEARPVRQAAAATLVVLMRHQTRWVTRIEICQHLVNDFCQSAASSDRLLFLYVCPIIGEHFSRRWYRDRILDHAVSLCDDDVAAVRARACQLLPEHRRQLGTHSPAVAADDDDAAVSERCTTSAEMLDDIVERLSVDPDQYVQEAARGVARILSTAAQTDADYESADRAKEAAEEAVFHDDCSNFSADFFKIKRSMSMTNLGDAPLAPLKPAIAGTTKKMSLTATPSHAPIPSSMSSTKAKAKTKMRKQQAADVVKNGAESSSSQKHNRIPTLPTRFIGSMTATVKASKSHSNTNNGTHSSTTSGKKR